MFDFHTVIEKHMTCSLTLTLQSPPRFPFPDDKQVFNLLFESRINIAQYCSSCPHFIIQKCSSALHYYQNQVQLLGCTLTTVCS